MPRSCTICCHPERASINEALVLREPYREISRRFGVSKSALSRHAGKHAAPLLAAARAVAESRDEEDLRVALAAVRQARTIEAAREEGRR